MKKLMLVALTVAAFGITSCGNDDDGGVDCVSLATNVSNAAETYGADQKLKSHHLHLYCKPDGKNYVGTSHSMGFQSLKVE